jgi:hypothetical protein
VELFSESPSRFLVEVKPSHAPAFESAMAPLPVTKIGTVVAQSRLRIAGANGAVDRMGLAGRVAQCVAGRYANRGQIENMSISNQRKM